MTDPPAPTQPPAPSKVPSWLQPDNIPPWVYLLVLLGTGGTGVGINMLGQSSAVKPEDLARVEAKVEKLDSRLESLDDKLTELRIVIATISKVPAN